MQHIVHVFIGDEPVAMRNQFAAMFADLHPQIKAPYITTLSLTKTGNGDLILDPGPEGDPLDRVVISSSDIYTSYHNYFESVYGRKVTVTTPGNRSLVVNVWAKLYEVGHAEVIKTFIQGVERCTSNILVEINGFTNDAVSTFISDPAQQMSPDFYRANFEDNVRELLPLRSCLGAFRLIANRNLENIALGFGPDEMTRVCVEFSALLNLHYLTFKTTFVNSAETPFESFGISAIKFDRRYYTEYLLKRVIIDSAESQNITDRRFNINALAQKSNPILLKFRDNLRDFYNVEVTDSVAELSVGSTVDESGVVGQMDSKFQQRVKEFRSAVRGLLDDKNKSIFEREALLSLILGEDCSMFDTSAVRANELTIDDMVDESARFFIDLDRSNNILRKVRWSSIRTLKEEMRNIAVANRQRRQQLKAIAELHKISLDDRQHIKDGKYNFDGTDYNISLSFDSEPLAEIYTPVEISKNAVDLRYRFAPVRDQKGQGSCAAFAVAAVIESLTGASTLYSPAFLYWYARLSELDTTSDTGASIYTVIKAAMDKGDCPEEAMPYMPEVFSIAPGEAANRAAEKCRVVGAKTVEPTLKAIKSALCEGYPVIVGAKIFNSFSDTHGGFVRNPGKEDLNMGERDDAHSNHAMVVCGYSDADKIFVVRNSWGTRFGDNGYCYIHYAYAEKYFFQACIITGVTGDAHPAPVPAKAEVLQFSRTDANISYAILQNLIDEDNEELNRKQKEYNSLKSIWTKNVADLGNVNNQNSLVTDAKAELNSQINEAVLKHNELQNTKSDKLKEFSKTYIKSILYLGAFVLLIYGLCYILPNWFTMLLSFFFSLLWVILVSTFAWQRKLKRQELVNEIQGTAKNIENLRGRLRRVGVQAHIHGEILKSLSEIKYELGSECEKQSVFNTELTQLYKKTMAQLKEMNPEVPYPFIAVIQNTCLDSYYKQWSTKMLAAVDFSRMSKDMEAGTNLMSEFENNPDINEQIVRGLKGFSMSQFLVRTDPERWRFIPTHNLSEVLQDLDLRATPFCPYSQEVVLPWAKYLFVNGLMPSDESKIRPWFRQSPLCVDSPDPDSIYLLSIARYSL